jgi:hypothetical protein
MCPVVIIFRQFSPKIQNYDLKKNIFEVKFAYVTNETAKSIKNCIYYYTEPCGTVICDSNGMTGDHILH